jgi:hypothetical protein
MSMYDLEIPAPEEHNYHEACQQQRVEKALKALTVSDVLSVLDDLIAVEPDAAKHPCHDLVAYLLDQAWTPGDGGQFWDAWKVLACQAIDQLINERLAQGED